MRALFLATSLFMALTGCTRAAEPVAPPSSSTTEQAMLKSTPLTLTPDQSQHAGVCPSQWTCDDINWFTTKAACQTSAACSTQTCFRDSHCTAGCICP
jgi:hypothetical protein